MKFQKKIVYIMFALSLLVLAACTSYDIPEQEMPTQQDPFEQQIPTQQEEPFIVETPLVESEVMATVNGVPIYSDEVIMAQQSFMQQGVQMNEQESLEQLINIELLGQIALQQGFELTTQEVEQDIEQQLTLQGINVEDYKQQLSTMGISFEQQLEQYAQQVAIQLYLEDMLSKQNFTATAQEAQELYDMYANELSNQTFEEVEQDLFAILIQEQEQMFIEQHVESLRADANIVYS
ncbi:MAG: hypothetical protein ACMXYC_04550 [Candidatus Woesearchaeota archaeon]